MNAGSLFKSHLFRAQEQAIPKCWESSKQGRRPAWLIRDLLQELRGQNTNVWIFKARTGNTGGLQRCCSPFRKKNPVPKAGLEFKLASTVKDKKNQANRKRRIRGNIDLLLNEVSHLRSREVDKAETFNALLASVFNTDDGPIDPWSP